MTRPDSVTQTNMESAGGLARGRGVDLGEDREISPSHHGVDCLALRAEAPQRAEDRDATHIVEEQIHTSEMTASGLNAARCAPEGISQSRPTRSHPALAFYKTARQRLLAEFEDLDEETLADTLEGMTDLNDVIAAIVRGALDDEALAEALKQRVKTMRERCDRILARARNRREIAAHLMGEAGLTRIVADDVTLSMRAGSPSLVVTDEGLIPADYWKSVAPTLDRRGLLDRLKAGASVAGAALSNPSPVLSVRVR